MKKRMAFLIVFCILISNLMGISVNITEAADEHVSIYVAGDSTAASYSDERAPLTGWAQVLGEFLPQNVSVKNHAESGTSSKSFVDSGKLDVIMNEIQSGDYLVIQFGHNDQKSEDATRYTQPDTTYKEYLKQFIDEARQRGATPILATPIERRRFANGKTVESLADYAKAMRELAKEEDVTLVDLNEETIRFYNFLGEEGTKQLFLILQPGDSPNYTNGITDNTHLRESGAREIVKIFLSELAKTSLPIAKYGAEIKSPVPAKVEETSEEGKEEDKTKEESSETESSKTKVDNSINNQAMNELVKNHILTGNENGDLNSNGLLTRAEFTAMIVRALSLSTTGDAPTFSDVPQNHWAAGSITAAYTNQILSGYDDGKFYPDAKVTYEQAAKVLVNIIGYEEDAKTRAPYPWGFILEASYNGMALDVNANAGQVLTRGQAAQMLYNSLYIPMKDGSVLADIVIGKTYFVSPNGYDLNDGSYLKPWKSFQKAASALKAGETAVFESGDYYEQEPACFLNSGKTNEPITVRARTKGAVNIVFREWGTAIEIPKGCNYINIDGFQMTSSKEGGRIISALGDDSAISENSFKGNFGTAVYSDKAKGIILEENSIKSADIDMNDVTNVVIRHNEIAEGGKAGILIQGTSKNIQVYSNYIYSMKKELAFGISLSAQSGVLWNNIIVSHAGGLIDAGIEFENTNNCHIYNSVLVGMRTGVSFKGENTAPVSKNNIFSDCLSDAYTFEKMPAGFVSDYNMYYNTYPNKLEKHSKYTDPGFVDQYSDWHVKKGSYVIHGGTMISPEFQGEDGETMLLDLRDFNKEDRGQNWNMGAYTSVSDLSMPDAIVTDQRSGKVLLFEKFDKENSAWAVSSGVWKIEAGKCKQTIAGAGRSIIKYDAGHAWTNYEFSANVMSPPSMPESTTGIIFRADENMQNMYVYRIYENTLLEVAKWQNGKFSSISKWNYTTNPDKVYNLKVKANNNKLTFYVDGVAVQEITDDSYSTGSIGLYAFKQIGEFDEVKVTAIERK